MKLSMEVKNIDGFSSTLAEYMKLTKKDHAEIMNTKGFFISRAASRNTVRADPAKMEKELGVAGYKVKLRQVGPDKGMPHFSKKTGKLKWIRQYGAGAPLAALIVNARKGRAGKPGLFGTKMKRAVEKVIGKRRRSMGTLKAGWLGAIRGLGSAIGQSSRVEGASSVIKGRGKAIAARPGQSVKAEIFYDVNSFDQRHVQYIDKLVADALEEAFRHELASMQRYIFDKMNRRIISLGSDYKKAA